jgi:hypothetical protein
MYDFPLIFFKHHEQVYYYECSWCDTKKKTSIIFSPFFFLVHEKQIHVKNKDLWITKYFSYYINLFGYKFFIIYLLISS